MSISSPKPKLPPSVELRVRNGAIPPLENGDRLTRDEFMRRYEAMPEVKKAELIEGVVYVPSPIRQTDHGEPHARLMGWLFVYVARTTGVELGDNSTVLMNLESAPQPDCVLFIQSEFGGKVVIDEDGYITGAPDLVAEVAASSVSYDLHDKLKAYERSGVREYIVWRVGDREIDWFVLQDGRYDKLFPWPDGTLQSTIFPGLWLDPAALLSGDLANVLATVEAGLSSPERAEFTGRLRKT